MLLRQRILIVDDRPENLLALERTLAGPNTELVRATSGEQALAATLDSEFALAILDVRMPGMDGYELASLLRGDPKTREMPIVFLTAQSSAEEQIFKGYESGAVDYIVKPFNPSVLVSKVKIFLELHAQKAEINRQRDQLATVNNELEAFVYSVSHDLRAPLRAIEGFSQALLEDCPHKLNEREKDYLLRISSEISRMNNLVDDLLLLSRVARAELEMERVDLSEQARQIMTQLRDSESDRNVEILVTDGLVANGDQGLVRQALENLLSNAWKFTRRTERARIEVSSAVLTGERVFFVRDNGVGFDMEYSAKLFTPFQRLHGMKEFPGTGIGLSTVQRIVQRHGGRVWFKSEVGQGATFFFTFASVEAHQDA